MALIKGIEFKEDTNKKMCPICTNFYNEDELVSTADGDYTQEMNKGISEILDDEYKKSKDYLLCEDCFEEMHQKCAAENELDQNELEEQYGDL